MRRTPRGTRATLATALLALLLAGCAGDGPAAGPVGLAAVDEALSAPHAADELHAAIRIDSTEELSRGAEVVLVGTVAEVRSIRFGGLAYEVTVEVMHVARGDVPDEITLLEYPVGDGATEPRPRLSEGEEYLFYLLGFFSDEPYYSVYGANGLFPVEEGLAKISSTLSDAPAAADLQDMYAQLDRFPFEGPLGPDGERLDVEKERERARATQRTS